MDKIEVLVRASALHDAKTVDKMKTGLLKQIASATSAFEIEDVSRPSGDRLAAVLVLTGGTEREVLKVIAQLPPPALLIAHPAHNSLPASLEILARIRQDGGEGRILFGSPEEIAAGLEQELVIANAWEGLRFSRVGLIGEPSDWLVASEVDRAFLKGRLSVELIPIEMKELLTNIAQASAAKKDISKFKRGAKKTDERASADVPDSVVIYEGLRSLIDEHRLDACTVRCFDLVTELEQTGCYALSRLNDEQIPAGCEGDLQALFTLFVAYLLTGQAAFMGNIASVDQAGREIGIAHCTCPLSATTQYSIATHFETDLGVGIAGTLPTGPCTVFRLGGERLDRLFVREGTMEETTFRDDLCRTQVRVSIDGPVDVLLEAPLGNHHILLQGHHRKTIETFYGRYLKS
jgi:L-fucose isomerase-like protein